MPTATATPPKGKANKMDTAPAADQPTVTVVTVTPEMAEHWLAQNKVNRKIRQDRVEQYKRDMAGGTWLLDGSPIKFGRDGSVLDGQHRLWAVIRADVPVPMFVATGIDEAAQLVMDSGAARTLADNLRMLGEPNAALMGAAARIGWVVDNGLIARRRSNWTPSKLELYGWIESNPNIRNSCLYVWTGPAKKVPLRPAIKAYCHYRFAQIDVEGAEQFFTSLGDMTDLKPGSPLAALASRLYQAGLSRTHIHIPEGVSLCFRAWNATREGRTMFKIPLVTRGTTILPELI